MMVLQRMVAAIVVQYIQCRMGKEMIESDLLLTYHVLKRERINFGRVFIHNFELTHKNGYWKLPYGCLLTPIFNYYGVMYENEPSDIIKDYFTRRNVATMKGKQKRGEDDGEDKAEDVNEKGGISLNSPTRTPNIGQRLFARLTKIEQRQKKLKVTIRKLQSKSKIRHVAVMAKLQAIVDLISSKPNRKMVCNAGRTLATRSDIFDRFFGEAEEDEEIEGTSRKGDGNTGEAGGDDGTGQGREDA